jgi:ubiquitin-conjugating enzyme E2 variant
MERRVPIETVPMSQRPGTALPIARQHDGSSLWTFWFEIVCVFTAVSLIIAHFVVVWQYREHWTWWQIVAIVLAWPAADFVSGIVHWLADTWGSEKFPILGPRFIRPFRVHHVTPTSFLECNFFDTNGDTCLIAIPVLLSFFALPLDTSWGISVLTFGVCFCAFAIPTNQIHQWAHMPQPPRWVKLLQSYGLILSNEEHSRHHTLPYAGYYCITTGFCNRWLERIYFFRGLECLITTMTGIPPRLEEQQAEQQAEQHSVLK